MAARSGGTEYNRQAIAHMALAAKRAAGPIGKRGRRRRLEEEVGHQLAERVRRGEITPERAREAARERQGFKHAYGENWREQVYGKGGARGISGPLAESEVKAQRSKALEAARTMYRRHREDQLANAAEAEGNRMANRVQPIGIAPATPGDPPQPQFIPPAQGRRRPRRRRKPPWQFL
jgi:hypothetical protein